MVDTNAQYKLNFRAKRPPLSPPPQAQGILNFGANLPRVPPAVTPAQGSLNFAATPPAPPVTPAQGSLNFNAPLPPPPPAQGSLNFNAPPQPIRTAAPPAQGSLNLGPPRPLAGSFTPSAAPPAAPVTPPSTLGLQQAQAMQQASRVANGLPPVRGGAPVAPNAPPPAAPPPSTPAGAAPGSAPPSATPPPAGAAPTVPGMASRALSGVRSLASGVGNKVAGVSKLVAPVVLGADAIKYATDEDARNAMIKRYGDPVADIMVGPAGPAAAALVAGAGGAGEEVANYMTFGGLRKGIENQKTGKYNVVEGGNVVGDVVNNAANVFGGIGDAILGIPGAVKSFFGADSNVPTIPPNPQSKPSATTSITPIARYTTKANPDIVTATRPEGTATFGRNTSTPDSTNIVSRISPENPYGADVVGLARPGRPSGYTGAATDAEAARNLQARQAQDQATQAEVARLNRATAAVKEVNDLSSPKASFGVTSFGGGPDRLDVASGRVVNRDTPASVVAGNMRSMVESAPGFSKKGAREAAATLGQSYLADKQLTGIEAQTAGKSGVDPMDLQKYLLDQGKFNWQQGVDKERLTVDAAKASADISGQNLKQKEYDNKVRSEFVKNFVYPDKGAPNEELGAMAWQISEATKGAVPPEMVTKYIKRAADFAKIDWTEMTPENLVELGKQATALAVADIKR